MLRADRRHIGGGVEGHVVERQRSIPALRPRRGQGAVKRPDVVLIPRRRESRRPDGFDHVGLAEIDLVGVGEATEIGDGDRLDAVGFGIGRQGVREVAALARREGGDLGLAVREGDGQFAVEVETVGILRRERRHLDRFDPREVLDHRQVDHPHDRVAEGAVGGAPIDERPGVVPVQGDGDLLVGRNQSGASAVGFVPEPEPDVVRRIAEGDEAVTDRGGDRRAVRVGGQVDIELTLKLVGLTVIERTVLGRVFLREVEEGVVSPRKERRDQIGGIIRHRQNRRREEPDRNEGTGARDVGREMKDDLPVLRDVEGLARNRLDGEAPRRRQFVGVRLHHAACRGVLPQIDVEGSVVPGVADGGGGAEVDDPVGHVAVNEPGADLVCGIGGGERRDLDGHGPVAFVDEKTELGFVVRREIVVEVALVTGVLEGVGNGPSLVQIGGLTRRAARRHHDRDGDLAAHDVGFGHTLHAVEFREREVFGRSHRAEGGGDQVGVPVVGDGRRDVFRRGRARREGERARHDVARVGILDETDGARSRVVGQRDAAAHDGGLLPVEEAFCGDENDLVSVRSLFDRITAAQHEVKIDRRAGANRHPAAELGVIVGKELHRRARVGGIVRRAVGSGRGRAREGKDLVLDEPLAAIVVRILGNLRVRRGRVVLLEEETALDGDVLSGLQAVVRDIGLNLEHPLVGIDRDPAVDLKEVEREFRRVGAVIVFSGRAVEVRDDRHLAGEGFRSGGIRTEDRPVDLSVVARRNDLKARVRHVPLGVCRPVVEERDRDARKKRVDLV